MAMCVGHMTTFADQVTKCVDHMTLHNDIIMHYHPAKIVFT